MFRRARRLFSRKRRSRCCGDEEAGAIVFNLNPYAPVDLSGAMSASGGQVRRLAEDEGLDFERLSWAEQRYGREFLELGQLGSGEFGSVHRVVNRLDGREYAVKRSRSLVRSSYGQRRARNEVHANAILPAHENLVRYYGAWLERGCIYIQEEYCNAGDLGRLVDRMRDELKFFREPELQRIILHVAEGLKYMHQMNLAHMDIKPENIFMCKKRISAPSPSNRGKIGKKEDTFVDEITYKIGDMGHVTSTINVKELEDEGDSRYLAKEILRDDLSDLPKADVLALGMTIYDVAGGGPLPQNGPEWHSLREGNLRRILRYSDDFHLFIRRMIYEDSKWRLSAADIVQSEYVHKNTDILAEFRY